MKKYSIVDTLSIKLDVNKPKDKKIIDFMSNPVLLPNLTSNFNKDKIFIDEDNYNYDNLTKYYNKTLSNVNLKRACCLRRDKNVDTYGEKEDFFVNFPDFKKENNLGYVSQKVVINGLKDKCSKLSIGDRKEKVSFDGRGTEFCDQFYKTYCKANAGIYYEYGKDLSKEKEYFRKIKYRDDGEAMECSCLNSPLINDDVLFNNLKSRDGINIDDRKIVYIDGLCGKETPYQTSEQKSENSKRTSITICSMSTNIGSARDIKLQGNVTKQDCGNTYVGDKKIDDKTSTNNNEIPITETNKTSSKTTNNNGIPITETNKTSSKTTEKNGNTTTTNESSTFGSKTTYNDGSGTSSYENNYSRETSTTIDDKDRNKNPVVIDINQVDEKTSPSFDISQSLSSSLISLLYILLLIGLFYMIYYIFFKKNIDNFKKSYNKQYDNPNYYNPNYYDNSGNPVNQNPNYYDNSGNDNTNYNDNSGNYNDNYYENPGNPSYNRQNTTVNDNSGNPGNQYIGNPNYYDNSGNNNYGNNKPGNYNSGNNKPGNYGPRKGNCDCDCNKK